jgi:allantoinase
MSNPRIPFEMSNHHKKLAPPDGKPLMVHVVLNVEHWRFDQPMPRKIIPGPHGFASIPDIPNFAWAEYGMRCGMPRIMNLLAERGLVASTALNAGVIDTHPAAAEAMAEAGWEFIGHGFHQRALDAEAEEASLVTRALDKIAGFTGTAPRGWLGPGLRESADTPDILRAADIEYVCDWVVDDLPCWMTTKHGPLIAMPYNLEINDSVLYAVEKHSSPEIYERLKATLSTFDGELADQPRVLALGLHPHLIGVPHRIGYLANMLDLLMARDDVTFMTGSQIADWFIDADKESS